jgi:hypothetical protein
MKCLTNEQIQRFVDGEMPSLQPEQFQHLTSCTSCQELYKEQKVLAKLIKKQINSVAKSPERIPEFQIPVSITPAVPRVKRFPLWAKVAALLIPACFVWKMAIKPDEKEFKPTAESIQLYEMCNSVDANTAFQENVIVTTVRDDKGKVIECSTN